MSNKYLFPAVVLAAIFGVSLAFILGESIWLADIAQLAKTLFLSALKMIVAPLIFFSLIAGILRLGNVNQLGRIGSVTIGYYLLTTSVAITLGLISVFLIHPWTSMPPLVIDVDSSTLELISNEEASIWFLLTGLVEKVLVNPFTALAELNILAIVVNALIIGVALLFVVKEDDVIMHSIDTITAALFKLTSWVIWVVPIGVAGIVYQVTLSADLTLIKQLVVFSALVFGVTIFHGFIVLPTIAIFLGRTDLRTFFRHAARPLLVAFTTSSSAATLPVTLKAAEDLKVNRSTFSFVVPFGATANMDGSALFEGIAAVFIAYLFGVELDGLSIVAIFFAAMMASIGAPGIPSGSMAGMQMVLLAVNLPLEGILILQIVERPLDMIRTAVNVQGDLVGSVVVDRYANIRQTSSDPTDSDITNAPTDP